MKDYFHLVVYSYVPLLKYIYNDVREKIEIDPRENKIAEIDRRSYIKSLAAAGSGLTLGGVGTTAVGMTDVQAAPSTIENFERSNPLADYSGHTDLYTITTSSTEVIEGSILAVCPLDRIYSLEWSKISQEIRQSTTMFRTLLSGKYLYKTAKM